MSGFIDPADPILMALDLDSQEREERLRMLLREEGREDILADYDAKMRDIRSGVEAARNCWHSISEAQRRVLVAMQVGCRPVARLATMRALTAHELVAPDGGVFDPEARFALTERGRFVVAVGRPVP